jgi:hypothetical protein
MEIMEIRDISVTNTGPVGLIEEFKLLTLLGTSDHKAVQVWLVDWQACRASQMAQWR